MNKEIEIKIKIDQVSHDRLLAWLKVHATYEGVLALTDYYLNDPDKPFFFTKSDGEIDALTYLRIRESKTENQLCLKHVHRDEKTNKALYCDEHEITITSVAQALELFKALGYTHVTKVEKRREVYRYSFFEIVSDTVQDLGDFVEIELKKPVDSPHVGHELIESFLHSIGITEYTQLQQGYVRMLWNKS